MKLSKQQLKRIIREEKARILSEAFFTEANRGSLDHLIQCYLDTDLSDEECADSLPNDVNIEGLQDFANYVMRVVNIYRQLGNF